jgi:hypothetical protein
MKALKALLRRVEFVTHLRVLRSAKPIPTRIAVSE